MAIFDVGLTIDIKSEHNLGNTVWDMRNIPFIRGPALNTQSWQIFRKILAHSRRRFGWHVLGK